MMKNDISFIIASDLSLYEQQSTFNPNMPLRGFLYYGHLYEQYVKKMGYDIYGKTLVKIPSPKYVVFYNGLDEKDDCVELKLSDAFINPRNLWKNASPWGSIQILSPWCASIRNRCPLTRRWTKR